VGGAWPGINKMSTYVTAGRTGSWVFTEAVDLLPAGWNPLHVDLGYNPETSTTSVMFLDEVTAQSDKESMIEEFILGMDIIQETLTVIAVVE